MHDELSSLKKVDYRTLEATSRLLGSTLCEIKRGSQSFTRTMMWLVHGPTAATMFASATTGSERGSRQWQDSGKTFARETTGEHRSPTFAVYNLWRTLWKVRRCCISFNHRTCFQRDVQHYHRTELSTICGPKSSVRSWGINVTHRDFRISGPLFPKYLSLSKLH